MKNRPRPAIPVVVKLAVAYRQYLRVIPAIAMSFAKAAKADRRTGASLASVLALLAEEMGVPGDALPLDHDPPLRWRKYVPIKKDIAARYTPNANDPEALIYRTLADHKRKTNLRGDGAQFPDRVLIKRERRREKEAQPIKRGVGSRPKSKASRAGRLGGGHAKIPARPFPPRGSRPFRRNR